jgi:hypothetical protein
MSSSILIKLGRLMQSIRQKVCGQVYFLWVESNWQRIGLLEMIWGSGVELSNSSDMYEQMTSSEEKGRGVVINIWLNKLKKYIEQTKQIKWRRRRDILYWQRQVRFTFFFSINSSFSISHLLFKLFIFNQKI